MVLAVTTSGGSAAARPRAAEQNRAREKRVRMVRSAGLETSKDVKGAGDFRFGIADLRLRKCGS